MVSKIHPEVMYTPDIAVPPIDPKWSRPYTQRRFGICFSASDWKRRMKNRALTEMVAMAFPDVRIAICGDRLNLPIPNVVDFGLVSHTQMLDIMGNSRVVVIPSMYDPSPNLYAEATILGCNVVVSTNVGNIDKHPKMLLCRDLSVDSFVEATKAGLAMGAQARYRKVDPEASTKKLLEVLEGFVRSRRPRRRRRR